MKLVSETEIARKVAGMIATRAHQQRTRKAAKTRARRTNTKIKRAAKAWLEGKPIYPKCLCGRELRTAAAIERGVGPCCWAKIESVAAALTATPKDQNQSGNGTVVALRGWRDAPEQPDLFRRQAR